MSNYKTFGYKIIFLILLIVGLNYIYKFIFYEKDIQTHSRIINLVRNVVNEKSEIVYIGESSNITFRNDDIDKRSISEFISDYYSSIRFGSITKEASHAGIYYELLRNIPENSSVKTVIVTLNLRSFDANWIYSSLETPLQKSLVLLKDYPPLINRFLLAFRGYDIKTVKEREKQFMNKWKNDTLKFSEPFLYNNVIDWDRGMAEHGIRNVDGTKNNTLTELACHYIKTYAFQIDTLTNPRIKDFDKIVQLSKERHWNLIYNLMAENIERADSLVGKELVYLIQQNRDLLKKRYNKNNVIVVDNLDCVGDSEYIDRNWTTEHYSEKGRKIIAKNVALCLKLFYPKAYVDVKYTKTKPYEFFNNCEGNLIWGQMQTLTSENSYSGEKSSKTGQKQDFSITLEYPINNLPDSLKQVSISMQIFQNDLNHDAKLNIEVSGKNIVYHLDGVLIKNLTRKIQKWDELNYNYILPEDFNKADLIKIYVYNITNSIIYVDDLKIKFKK
jgi:hypothetical protein